MPFISILSPLYFTLTLVDLIIALNNIETKISYKNKIIVRVSMNNLEVLHRLEKDIIITTNNMHVRVDQNVILNTSQSGFCINAIVLS
tara:strand:+ start:3188 stop:3451 length:264 start_codon:yes stop_codon:yes gene_type:complete